MTNRVEVDAAALALEADQVAREFVPAPEIAPPPPAHDPTMEQAEAGYKALAAGIVAQGALLVIPNWHITGDETTALGDSIVMALMLWFPDGLIPPKYLSLLAIIGVCGSIAMARRHPDTGELPPRHAPIKNKPISVPPAGAVANPNLTATNIQAH